LIKGVSNHHHNIPNRGDLSSRIADIPLFPNLHGDNDKNNLISFLYLLGGLSMIFFQREVVLPTQNQAARFGVLQPYMPARSLSRNLLGNLVEAEQVSRGLKLTRTQPTKFLVRPEACLDVEACRHTKYGSNASNQDLSVQNQYGIIIEQIKTNRIIVGP
jgi:hypothetical protein